jgi:cytidyltransferase-like protein
MTIVFADMVMDIFHSGHVKFLRNISQFGDRVIAGLITDEDAASYKRTPIISLRDRAEVVRACKYVDEVIEGSPLIVTEEFLIKHKIDLVVHAHDESDHSYDFVYEVPMKLGKFRRLEYTSGISTTEIIERCKKR